jgi:hypothetical protein
VRDASPAKASRRRRNPEPTVQLRAAGRGPACVIGGSADVKTACPPSTKGIWMVWKSRCLNSLYPRYRPYAQDRTRSQRTCLSTRTSCARVGGCPAHSRHAFGEVDSSRRFGARIIPGPTAPADASFFDWARRPRLARVPRHQSHSEVGAMTACRLRDHRSGGRLDGRSPNALGGHWWISLLAVCSNRDGARRPSGQSSAFHASWLDARRGILRG